MMLLISSVGFIEPRGVHRKPHLERTFNDMALAIEFQHA